jgi:integrase
MAKITKKLVDSLAPGDVVWEQGFGVRANADGTRSFLLSYRVGRRKRRYTVGIYGSPWTVDTARKRARELQRDLMVKGVDPLAVKVTTREAPTVRELTDRFMREHVGPKRKTRTAMLYRGYIDKHILPAMGRHAVRDVTRADVSALHHKMRATPVAANRTLLLVSAMMNKAEKWGLRGDGTNPCRHVDKYPEQARERYLARAEFKRLGQALVAAESGPVLVPGEADPTTLSTFALAAIKFSVFSGCRRSEIETLQWSYVDLENDLLRLPFSKSGPKVVVLNSPAVAILANMPRIEGNPYVFAGEREGGHVGNLTRTWYAIRAIAKLDGVRLHDLRHSFASVGAGGGLSLQLIGGLLGHSQPQTTARYAHLALSPLKQAAELVGQQISAAMGS